MYRFCSSTAPSREVFSLSQQKFSCATVNFLSALDVLRRESSASIAARSWAICVGCEVGRTIHPSHLQILSSTLGDISALSGDAECAYCWPPATQTGGTWLSGSTVMSFIR